MLFNTPGNKVRALAFLRFVPLSCDTWICKTQAPGNPQARTGSGCCCHQQERNKGIKILRNWNGAFQIILTRPRFCQMVVLITWLKQESISVVTVVPNIVRFMQIECQRSQWSDTQNYLSERWSLFLFCFQDEKSFLLDILIETIMIIFASNT